MVTVLRLALLALLGLAFGSFLNVVIYRLPQGESVVRPRSHCPNCLAAVRPRDEVPVISWLLLRGRCRDCQAPISARYALVELLTAAAFVLLGVRFGASLELAAFLYLAAVGITLAFIDLDVRRLPNVLTLPSYLLGGCLLALAAASAGDTEPLLRAVAGMAAAYLGYFLLLMMYPRGIGFGDVKLAGLLGLYLGWLSWSALAIGLFAGFMFGGVFGIALMAAGRAGRKTKIPFGPFMIAGAFLAIFIGAPLAHAYTNLTLG